MYNVNLIYLKIGFFFLLQLSSFIVYKWMLSCIEVVLFNRYLLSFCPLYSDVFHFFLIYLSRSLSLYLHFCLIFLNIYLLHPIRVCKECDMKKSSCTKNVFEYLFFLTKLQNSMQTRGSGGRV